MFTKVILSILALAVLAVCGIADAGKRKAETLAAVTVDCVEPMDGFEAFATRSAPCPAPEGEMTPGATYTTTLESGEFVKFLFNTTGLGYVEKPFGCTGGASRAAMTACGG
jgi:hypothetical protein